MADPAPKRTCLEKRPLDTLLDCLIACAILFFVPAASPSVGLSVKVFGGFRALRLVCALLSFRRSRKKIQTFRMAQDKACRFPVLSR